MARLSLLPEKPLPYDLDAELALLGALMLSGNISAAEVRADDFFVTPHRQLYEAITECAKTGPIDAVNVGTIAPDLRSLILDAQSSCCFVANIEEYARIVRDKARLRSMIFAAHDIVVHAYDAGAEADEVEQYALAKIRETQRSSGKAAKTLRELVNEELTVLQGRQNFLTLPGFPNIAICPGELVIIGARPKQGKSAFAAWLALDFARTHKVAFYSYEMSSSQIVRRIIARFSGLSISQMNDGLDAEDGATIRGVMDDELDRDFTLKECGGQKPADLFASLRRFAADGGRVAFIDYIQLAAKASRDLRSEITVFSNELKQVALSTGLTIVALSQLRRPDDERALRPPSPSELRETGALEQDADAVFLMMLLPSLRDPEMGVKASEYASARLTHHSIAFSSLELDGAPWHDKRLMFMEAALVRQGEPGRCPFVFDGSVMDFQLIPRLIYTTTQ